MNILKAYANRAYRLSTMLVLLTSLFACTTQTIKPPANQDPETAFEIRQEQVGKIDHWKVKARIAIKTVNDSNTASIYWQQQADAIELRLQGPFGVQVALITGSSGRYTLKDKRGDVWQASNIDALVYQRTGWVLPLEKLRYWILADVQNRNEAQFALNNDGTLASLQYQQWLIDYQKYQTAGEQLLPKKIAITHPDVTIKISVREWLLGKDDG